MSPVLLLSNRLNLGRSLMVIWLCLCPGAGLLLANDTPRLPNVLFLFTDDQRADTIAALGNPVVITPRLDQLARESFVFKNAYCMGSTMPAVCNPSRHMVQSGMSLYRFQQQPDSQTPSLARSFASAGYETYHHSKKGNSATAYHKHYEHSHYLEDMRERNSGHHGRTIATDAVQFLKQRSPERPFLMYLGFAGPHDPRVAAEEFLSLYDRDQIPLPPNYMSFHPFDNGELLIRDERLNPWPRDEQAVRKHLHDYYACISSIDRNIGRILDALEQTGERERTLILFSSDHGLAVGSHGLMGKQNLYEHSMKAPLMVCGPGISPGQSESLVYLHDIFPTLCDLAGIPVAAGLDGKSLKPIVTGKQDSVRDDIFLAYKTVQRAIRKDNWKLIRYPAIDRQQLFDLKQDPHEMHDLSAMPEHRARVDELRKLLAQRQLDAGDHAPLTVETPAAGEIRSVEEILRRFPKE